MTTSKSAASVHGTALSLVHHYRVGDLPAVACLLAELDGPERAGEVIASLCQLCCRIIDERPIDGHAWLSEAMLRLAEAEAGDVG